MNIRKFRTDKRVAGCAEVVCRPHMRHRACDDCGRLTDGSRIRVEPGSLRRRKRPVCSDCLFRGESAQQQRLRAKRAQFDWERLTDPLCEERLVAGALPEQYAGPTRATIRAFRESSEGSALVLGISATTLNHSLATLGLLDEMYAETRGEQTVLRKVG